MSPAWVTATIGFIVLLLTIICETIAITWWASRMDTKLEQMDKVLACVNGRCEKEMVEHYTKTQAKEDHAKRDELIATMWKKFDTLHDKVVVMENELLHFKNGGR